MFAVQHLTFLCSCAVLLLALPANSFTPPPLRNCLTTRSLGWKQPDSASQFQEAITPHFLKGSLNDDEQPTTSFKLDEFDQTVTGVTGIFAALVTFYSEFVLKQTGCGLPAGPYGVVGLVEGLSYLGVVRIAALSLYQKYQTGSGLPAGPAGVLGAAEGLSFLSIAVGLTVFFLQITNFGYIPNAIPMEGGMCS
mmetsp:Transcript_28173/g.39646  ORF Transcript_28173/g.39646 Transcript_28173/m.39646 type:complete len:194 (+) Transcript_28173:92-673(+)